MPIFLNCEVGGSGKPSARVGDSVSCPQPGHNNVTIVSGCNSVLHNDQLAARVGDKTSCGATIIEGSSSVFINGKPAAFVGCATSHCGKITSGSPDIFIGNTVVNEAETGPDKPFKQFSMSVDLKPMHEAGSHNDISYNLMAVEITKPDGTYITTTGADEHGITHRFYTEEQEEVVVWADFGHWDVSEEFEDIDYDDAEETEHV